MRFYPALSARHFVDQLGFAPTADQTKAFECFAAFLQHPELRFMLLKGHAGTGKTTIVRAIASALSAAEVSVSMAAPTGRAAKILSQKTGFEVSTIHHLLYDVVAVYAPDDKAQEDVLYWKFVRKVVVPAEDRLYPPVLIIDEASMLSDLRSESEKGAFESECSPLEDLVRFVEQAAPHSKILFVGDPYQLPPVQMDFAPAMSRPTLYQRFKWSGVEYCLQEVKRQQADSYILQNAAHIRQQIERGWRPAFSPRHLADMHEAVRFYGEEYNKGNSITMISWKNEHALRLNQQVRQQLLGHKALYEKLLAKDLVMLRRSYYGAYYLPSGEIATVRSVGPSWTSESGFEFADVVLECTNHAGTRYSLNAKANLSLIEGALDPKVMQDMRRKLFAERCKKNDRLRKSKDPRTDAYLSAIELSYAHCLTCHKAQGGEWDKVIIHPDIPFGRNSGNWLYTAVTRARQDLYSFAS